MVWPRTGKLDLDATGRFAAMTCGTDVSLHPVGSGALNVIYCSERRAAAFHRNLVLYGDGKCTTNLLLPQELILGVKRPVMATDR